MSSILVTQQQGVMSFVNKHGCLQVKQSHNKPNIMGLFHVKQLIPSGSYLCLLPSGAMPLQVINTGKILQELTLFNTKKIHDICGLLCIQLKEQLLIG